MLYYKIKGSGTPLVFIHGYLENHLIWEEFIQEINNYKCISIDLPGYGNSPFVEPEKKKIGNYTIIKPIIPSIEYFVTKIVETLEEINIKNAHFVGHSMGGYTILELAKKYPNYIKSLTLMNSHPFADTPEKKEARLKEVNLIKEGKKETLINQFVEKLYTPGFLKKYIEFSKEIALQVHHDTMIFSLLAMKDREDYSSFVLNFNKPILIIIGENDPFIPIQKINELPENSYLTKVKINNSAHMSFIEKKEEVLKILLEFLNKS